MQLQRSHHHLILINILLHFYTQTVDSSMREVDGWDVGGVYMETVGIGKFCPHV